MTTACMATGMGSQGLPRVTRECIPTGHRPGHTAIASSSSSSSSSRMASPNHVPGRCLRRCLAAAGWRPLHHNCHAWRPSSAGTSHTSVLQQVSRRLRSSSRQTTAAAVSPAQTDGAARTASLPPAIARICGDLPIRWVCCQHGQVGVLPAWPIRWVCCQHGQWLQPYTLVI